LLLVKCKLQNSDLDTLANQLWEEGMRTGTSEQKHTEVKCRYV